MQGVGTAIGNVYKGQEGVGLAHVFGRTPGLESLAVADAQKRANDAKARAEKLASLERPEDIWHYYSADINAAWDNYYETGAMLMSTGVNDPWISTDPKAIEWRKEGSRLKAAASNVKQAKDLYDAAMSDIGVRGDQYTPEYIESVKKFPAQVSLDQMAGGQWDFPEARFKTPGKLFTKYYKDLGDQLQKQAGEKRLPSDQEIYNNTKMFFASGEHEPERVAAKQQYESLNDRAREEMDAMAEELGYDEGYMALLHKNLKNRFSLQPLDMNKSLQESGARMPIDLSRWSTEDFNNVTKAGYSKKLIRMEPVYNEAKNFWILNDAYLEDQATMSGMGIPMTIPKEARRDLAEQYYAKAIVDRAAKESESRLSRGGTGGATKEELAASYDLWRQTLSSQNLQAANEAAGFASGAKNIPGFGTVVDGKIIPEVAGPMSQKLRQASLLKGGEARVLRLTFGTEEEAQRARDNFLTQRINVIDQEIKTNASIDPVTGQVVPVSTAEVDRLEVERDILREYAERATGKSVDFPLIREEEQVLKLIHQRAFEAHKALFAPVGPTGVVDPLGMGAGKQVNPLDQFDQNY